MLVSNLPELGILVRNVAHGTLFFFNFHHFGIIFQRIQGISVEILEPFLKFVFVEPLESPQYQPMKVCLQRELLALASQSDSIMLRKITGFLANILPCLQVSINNFAPVLYSFTFLIDLNKMYRCLVLWWVYKHYSFLYRFFLCDAGKRCELSRKHGHVSTGSRRRVFGSSSRNR